MKIEIANPKTIYERLTSPATSPMESFFIEAQKQFNEGNSWKTEQPTKQLIQTGFGSSNASLVCPLDYACFHFSRIGDNYSGEVRVYFQNEFEQLNGLSEKLKKVFGDNWISKNKVGEGYILYNNEPIINIAKDAAPRNISIGKSGTVPRTLDSLENFIQDICNLEKATNVFVNSAIDLYVEKGKIKSNPDFKVYLTCR